MTTPLQKAIELRPCPFCGGEAVLHDATQVLGVWRLVHRCEIAPIITIEKSTPQLCAKAWNTRQHESQQAVDDEKMKLAKQRLDWLVCDCGDQNHKWALNYLLSHLRTEQPKVDDVITKYLKQWHEVTESLIGATGLYFGRGEHQKAMERFLHYRAKLPLIPMEAALSADKEA